MECRRIWHSALLIVWAVWGCHAFTNAGTKWLIDLHIGLLGLYIGMECRANWHGALVIVWALSSSHAHPNTASKWLNNSH